MAYRGQSGLLGKIKNVDSAQACGKLCQEDDQCLFWSYSTDNTNCFIRTSDSERLVLNEDKISGQKPCQ